MLFIEYLYLKNAGNTDRGGVGVAALLVGWLPGLHDCPAS